MFHTTVQSTHLDQFGHVNNARFFEYFEWARWDWAARHGFDFHEYMARGLSPAAVWMEISFHRELRFPDDVTIATEVSRIGEKSFTLLQRLFSGEDNLSATLSVKLVFVESTKKRAVLLPPLFRERLQQMKEAS
ncbi:acyl-CoA thioesterase [Myxococcota bacterium]|nr:acyl-CoA thioesterase [Myxococcota bacterium]MBU1534345.1 acyl-CoA thioesterase [Myxococcota bacterium]